VGTSSPAALPTGPADVVGFSNYFSGEGDNGALLAGAVAATAGFCPGPLPVVGYDRGEALTCMRRLGFSTSAPLRVWLTTE